MLLLDEPTAFLDVPSRVELMGLLRQLARENALAVVVSTHDLELALRTADMVWLVMPGGEIVTGAPEDVVLSGAIAQAFEGRQMRFDAEERAFRWLTGARGAATVRGHGLRAAMATAVLEREGYAVRCDPAEDDALVVHASNEAGGRWWMDVTDRAQTSRRSRRSCAEGEERHEHQHDAGRRRRDQPRGRRARVEGVGARRGLRHDRRAQFEHGVRAVDLRRRGDRGVHEERAAGSVQDRIVAGDAGGEPEAADRHRIRRWSIG